MPSVSIRPNTSSHTMSHVCTTIGTAGLSAKAAVIHHHPVFLGQRLDHRLVAAGDALQSARGKDDRRAASGLFVMQFGSVHFCSGHVLTSSRRARTRTVRVAVADLA